MGALIASFQGFSLSFWWWSLFYQQTWIPCVISSQCFCFGDGYLKTGKLHLVLFRNVGIKTAKVIWYCKISQNSVIPIEKILAVPCLEDSHAAAMMRSPGPFTFDCMYSSDRVSMGQKKWAHLSIVTQLCKQQRHSVCSGSLHQASACSTMIN